MQQIIENSLQLPTHSNSCLCFVTRLKILLSFKKRSHTDEQNLAPSQTLKQIIKNTNVVGKQSCTTRLSITFLKPKETQSKFLTRHFTN